MFTALDAQGRNVESTRSVRNSGTSSPTVANTSVPVGFGRYHALVIGNNAYKHLPRLVTAVNDAEAVADILRTRYGFEVTLLLEATRDGTK